MNSRAMIAASMLVLLLFACAIHSSSDRYALAPGSPLSLGSGAGRPVLADMNGDGVLDIVAPHDAAEEPKGRVTVFLGNGDGTFRRSGTSARVPLGGLKVAAGDLDEDGHVDVAVGAHDAYEVHLLFGDGAGGFRAEPEIVTTRTGDQPHTHSVALGDVDADGHLDLLVANADHNDVSVLLGNGDGDFTPASGSPFPAGVHPYEGIALDDIDGDRHLDIVLPNLHGGTISLLLGDGEGAFAHAPGSPFSVAPRPGSVCTGDLDGDGRVEIVASHDSGAKLSVLHRTDTGFAPHPQSPLSLDDRAWDVRIVDLDGDGRNDLVAGGVESDLFLHLSSRETALPARSTRLSSGAEGPGYLAIGDLHGDGLLDIVTGNFTSHDLSILLAVQ
ncbi:MAG: VCBS repeat-containing protein [Planctomycetota bacterium]